VNGNFKVISPHYDSGTKRVLCIKQCLLGRATRNCKKVIFAKIGRYAVSEINDSILVIHFS
jgi:hypothetical protein